MCRSRDASGVRTPRLSCANVIEVQGDLDGGARASGMAWGLGDGQWAKTTLIRTTWTAVPPRMRPGRPAGRGVGDQPTSLTVNSPPPAAHASRPAANWQP
jgi:hypothetical protein